MPGGWAPRVPHPSAPSLRRRWSPLDVPPRPEHLRSALGRALVAVVLLCGAALVAHRAGAFDQVLPYVVMAGAVLPHLALCALALVVVERRDRLRVSRRPVVALSAVAVVLAGAALVGAAERGMTWAPAWAAALAALGCGVAAAPPVVALRARG